MILWDKVVLQDQQVDLNLFIDKSNTQTEWSPKNIYQPKYSNRTTYIDDVQRLSRKQNCPSPDQYGLKMTWPKK